MSENLNENNLEAENGMDQQIKEQAARKRDHAQEQLPDIQEAAQE